VTAADELVLAYLNGSSDADALDAALRQEQLTHPDEVAAAMQLLHQHALLRSASSPAGLAGRIMARVRQYDRDRLHERTLATIRTLPAPRQRRRLTPLAWASAALLLLGIGVAFLTRPGDEGPVHVTSGAWIAADGRSDVGSPLPSSGAGIAASTGVMLCWSDGTTAQATPGSRLRLVDGVLQVEGGEVRCTVLPHSPRHPFRVRTLDATIAVVGTVFTVTVGGQTTCQVERGTVTFSAGGRTARIASGGTMTTAALASGLPAGWQLVWADEFVASGQPDPGRWRPWSRPTGSNHDMQRYDAAHAQVDHGALHITATRSASGWTSAALVAQAVRMRPGMRLDIRAGMPMSPGFWPLVWAVDADHWPAGAEIVFLSTTGDPAHWRWSLRDGQDMQLGVGPPVTPGYHDFSITWTSSGLICTRDGERIGTAAVPRDAGWTSAIARGLSLAVELTVTPEASAAAPDHQLDIDWIRLYRLQAQTP